MWWRKKLEKKKRRIKTYSYQRNGQTVKVKAHQRIVWRLSDAWRSWQEQRRLQQVEKERQEIVALNRAMTEARTYHMQQMEQARLEKERRLQDQIELERLAEYGNSFDVYTCSRCRVRWVGDESHPHHLEYSECPRCWQEGQPCGQIRKRAKEVNALLRSGKVKPYAPAGGWLTGDYHTPFRSFLCTNRQCGYGWATDQQPTYCPRCNSLVRQIPV